MSIQQQQLLANKVLSRINCLSGRQFEYYIGYFIKLLGYKDVRVTRATKDYGIDVICSAYNHRTIGIQCKHLSKNEEVGYHAIEEAIGGAQVYHLNTPVVITNKSFTPNAIFGASKCNVVLIGKTGLLLLIIKLLKEQYTFKQIFPKKILLKNCRYKKSHRVNKKKHINKYIRKLYKIRKKYGSPTFLIHNNPDECYARQRKQSYVSWNKFLVIPYKIGLTYKLTSADKYILSVVFTAMMNNEWLYQSNKQLARNYGVTIRTISGIISNLRHKHLLHRVIGYNSCRILYLTKHNIENLHSLVSKE